MSLIYKIWEIAKVRIGLKATETVLYFAKGLGTLLGASPAL